MTGNIFVVEGADGAGKSTFIARMVDSELGRYDRGRPPFPRRIHNKASDSQLPGSLYRHYRAQLLDAISFRDKGISTYIDRSFLSEVVYGGLYRGESRITMKQATRLERLALNNGIVLLGMVADNDTRQARLLERGEEWDGQQPFIGDIYSAYFQQHSYWITADSTSAYSTK